jgi:DNA-binding HxlR family transcriptional regulator
MRGRRYRALRRCLPGVSDKMLIQQLKELQAGGVIERTDHKEVPPAWTMLSPFGMSLAQSLAPLCGGEAHRTAIAAVVERRNSGAKLMAAE